MCLGICVCVRISWQTHPSYPSPVPLIMSAICVGVYVCMCCVHVCVCVKQLNAFISLLAVPLPLLFLPSAPCRPAPPVSQTVSSFAGCCCYCCRCSSHANNNNSSSNLPDCLTVILGSHMLSNWQTTPAPNQFPQNTQQHLLPHCT